MTERNKIRVAVLYGGRSGEHEVSLMSASSVIENLDRSRFEVVPIGIDKKGDWYLGDERLKKEISGNAVLQLQSTQEKKLYTPNFLGARTSDIQKNALNELTKSSSAGRPFDVVFPVIHGVLCEDGTIQGLLECADIPYVGCGVLSSAIGMDKDVSKRLIRAAGIPVPDYVILKHGYWVGNKNLYCDVITKQLTFPVFVKPANTGSSVGVHKVKEKKQLIAAIEDAFLYDNKVIVEQGIDAIELETAVLESLNNAEEPLIGAVGEIRPRDEFYSYNAKYVENGAELLIPASVSELVQEEVKTLAKKIFHVLECEGMARVDLFMEHQTNRIYFNEINTIPGFTKYSMYPKLMEANGYAYADLLTHLVMLAVKRQERKERLSREYVTNKEKIA